MGFTQPDFPQVDPDTFLDRPFTERLRVLGAHWAEYGFGTPKMVHVIYLLKVFVFYAGVGITIATLTSGLNPLHVTEWWNEPIVYQKAVLWTVLVEILGIGGSWGPLAGHFKPMTGGLLFWLRPQTIRLPPWPGKVPLTKGDAVAFAVHHRPVQGTRGPYRVNLRHGVSRIRSGHRHTVGVIFHDAK